MAVLKLKSSNYGYTLLELLVVVALIAIVLSAGIPSVQIIFNTKEKKELMEFKRDIVFARNSAVVENCVYVLYINVEKNSYKIEKKDKIPIIIKTIQFSNGIIITGKNFTDAVNFSSSGSPSVAGTIYITNRKKQNIQITITPATGNVNLYIKDK